MCNRLGLVSIAPLWEREQGALLQVSVALLLSLLTVFMRKFNVKVVLFSNLQFFSGYVLSLYGRWV